MAQSGPVWATTISCLDYWSRILFLPGSPTQFFSHRAILPQCKPGHTALLSKISVASVLQSQSNIRAGPKSCVIRVSLPIWPSGPLFPFLLTSRTTGFLASGPWQPSMLPPYKTSVLPIPLEGTCWDAPLHVIPSCMSSLKRFSHAPSFPSACSVYLYKRGAAICLLMCPPDRCWPSRW